MNVAGFASLIVWILIRWSQGGKADQPEEKAHGERFGIFAALWGPTFFVLASRPELAAQDNNE